MVRIAINGFGRIGRNAFKIAFDRNDAEIVAITHHVKHRRIERAKRTLASMPVVTRISSVIRVETPPTSEVE